MRDSSASRGARTHGGDVADVDGERLVADVGGRREAPVEVHALDKRVGGQHLQRPAIDHRHGRIVADADDERWRRRGKPPADVVDEPALSDAGTSSPEGGGLRGYRA